MTAKYIAVLLCAAILAVSLAGCGGGTDTPAVTTGTADTDIVDNSAAETTKAKPVLPTFDYEGYEFTILCKALATSGSTTWDIVDVYAEQQNGDLINDAVYIRNTAIEDKYNIKIVNPLVNSSDEMVSVPQTAVLAGDATYDAFQVDIERTSKLIVAGILLNLNLLPHLDFSQDWWDENIISDMSIAGKNYYATGSICLNDDKASWCILFNKKLAADFDLPNLYEIVLNGDWTIDKFYEFGAVGAADLNGDGQMTFADDRWGIYDQKECACALFLASGNKAVDKDSDDTLIYNLDKEVSVNAFQIIYDHMSDTTFHFNLDKTSISNVWVEARANFRADKALFFFTNCGALTLIRDMENDFGVLPVVKVFDTQDRYYNTVQTNNANVYSVPVTCTDHERTGILLESMAMGSDILTEAYYDNTLEQKAARDEESIEMLKLIFGNRIYDFSYAFASTGIMNFFRNLSVGATNTYASTEASSRETFIKAIELVQETILALP